ncbi:uncharacterized protein [Clytia hemisphaerica]|uniref:uncharacterized protein n=1 Tax=Clytia hemisphaerica TaxID=252671 RepID=UPI0034D46C0A
MQSGGSPKTSKFFDELDEVLVEQPNIEPRITTSSRGEVMTSEKTNKKKHLEEEEDDEESGDDSDDERKADKDVDKAELTLKERKRRTLKRDKKRKRVKYVPAAVDAVVGRKEKRERAGKRGKTSK